MANGTPVLIEGFDLYNAISALDAPGKWSSYANVSSSFGLTSGGRHGAGNSLKLNISGSNAALIKNLPDAVTRTQIGFAFRLNANPSAERRFMHLTTNDDNTNCRLAITAAGKLKLTVWGSTVVEAADSLPVGTWVWIEWVAFMNNPNGTHKVYVNGTEVITWGPGDNRPTGSSTRWANFTIGDTTLNLNADIDDLVVANATAVSSPDLFGDSRVSVLQPTSVGANTGFTESGAASLADALSGTAPAGDTSHAEAEDVDDALYMATSQSLPSNVSVVHAVALSLRHRKTGGGARTLRAGLRIDSTVYPASPDVTLFDGLTSSQHIYVTDPDTTDPWIKADVEDVQFGAKVQT